MALKLSIGNIVAFKVKGAYNDAAGKPVPFEFTLTCKRLDAKAMDDVVERLRKEDGYDFLQFFEEVVTDWSGITNDDGSAVPFSLEVLRQLLNLPGLATLSWGTYCAEVGAKAKN